MILKAKKGSLAKRHKLPFFSFSIIFLRHCSLYKKGVSKDSAVPLKAFSRYFCTCWKAYIAFIFCSDKNCFWFKSRNGFKLNLFTVFGI
ncbi:hypothetical protein D7Z94_21355 [Ulvibacterium marinum]|uniref:Uncharacterized protein n=1 Tax=Ulvibacterium marinum TaxID=2419782 RepID=A0A3B0C2K8_9FLAO|nr:hypothetical protein D7Z94_21355 [Ulvibacterium marinum]